MDAKEKANELLKKFGSIQLAKLAVDELLKEYSGYRVKHYLSFKHAMELKDYWVDVMYQLELL